MNIKPHRWAYATYNKTEVREIKELWVAKNDGLLEIRYRIDKGDDKDLFYDEMVQYSTYFEKEQLLNIPQLYKLGSMVIRFTNQNPEPMNLKYKVSIVKVESN